MYYYLAGQIVCGKDGETPHLTDVRIKAYSTPTSIAMVIGDYKAGIRYNGKSPIIVGRCNLKSDMQKTMLARALSGAAVPYSALAAYKSIFQDGFTIESNAKTEEDANKLISTDLSITGSKTLWKVAFPSGTNL